MGDDEFCMLHGRAFWVRGGRFRDPYGYCAQCDGKTPEQAIADWVAEAVAAEGNGNVSGA